VSALRSVDLSFNSLAESEQNTFKSLHSQLSCLTFSIKKGYCEDRLASLLVVSLGKALNGMASTFEWLDSGSNSW